mmetsp:Transcript_34610/g.80222  ORF Transcript_34610/g.80222 Transcript_34610/m.80222 type:complete len:216 (+) Transcript_34610:916-1563(+)
MRSSERVAPCQAARDLRGTRRRVPPRERQERGPRTPEGLPELRRRLAAPDRPQPVRPRVRELRSDRGVPPCDWRAPRDHAAQDEPGQDALRRRVRCEQERQIQRCADLCPYRYGVDAGARAGQGPLRGPASPRGVLRAQDEGRGTPGLRDAAGYAGAVALGLRNTSSYQAGCKKFPPNTTLEVGRFRSGVLFFWAGGFSSGLLVTRWPLYSHTLP